MSNIATTKISTAQWATTPFRQGWDLSQYVPLMRPYYLQPLRQIQLMSNPSLTGLTTSLSAFNISARRSMIYWIEPMLSTSSAMIIIQCRTSSRCVTKFGYICRRIASLDPTASFTCFDMDHTPLPRLWVTIPSSSTSHYSLVCT